MRFRLEFDIPDKDVSTLRNLVEKPIFGVQLRSGILYVDLDVASCTLTQLPNLSAVSTEKPDFQRAVLDTLHDLGIRYGCGGTSDHELVSDVLLSLEIGIRRRLNGEAT